MVHHFLLFLLHFQSLHMLFLLPFACHLVVLAGLLVLQVERVYHIEKLLWGCLWVFGKARERLLELFFCGVVLLLQLGQHIGALLRERLAARSENDNSHASLT
eukprot:TRINITY_DN2454_c0_g1_i2.p3 TRINITY_DN2454_c0_g1~~TRINITY_DN2454_c0_g1_i2.p3  ORF type:complete len:103 (+),score=11.75 TRINITY_DN2454_c0_g1_i2:217-525(+)